MRIPAKTVAKAAKYAPVAYAAVKHGREPVQKAVQKAIDRRSHQRQATAHAGTLTDGSVLATFHGGDRAWVVFSGDEPVAAYPSQQADLQDVIGRADLSKRVSPDAAAGSASRLKLNRGPRH
jgi:hypothetical protein